MPHLLILAQPIPPRSLEALGDLTEERTVVTPFGEVGPLARRRCDTCHTDVWILPYFGSPTRTDPRATIWAAKALDVQRILAVEGMVGLQHDLTRGDIVLPIDYIDWTKHQPTTFFEQTGAGYISQKPPFCPDISAAIRAQLPSARPVLYLGDEGPRHETAAEARMFQQWGAQVRGLNLVPETYLAKEMELCFAAIGLITAHGADRERAYGKGEVRRATREVLEALPAIFAALPDPPQCGCNHLQDSARQRGVLPDDWREWK
jgi:5'-methylthioadenosine phosphorylase